MADDDWRNERRNWRGTGRWEQDDASRFDRDRDYPRLGYGPYAWRERAGMDRAGRYGRKDEQRGRYYGQGYRSRYDEDRFRSARSSAYGTGYRGDYGRDEDRGWMDRAGDEVASWFGDDEAEYRRRMDRRRDEAERYYRRDRDDDYLAPGRSRRRWRDDW